MSQLFLIAYRNLIQHRKRTLLLGGAIAGVTALLVFLMCLSAGVRGTLFRSATVVMTGHINIGGFYKVTAGQAAPLVTEYQKIQTIVKKALPDLDFMAARGRGWARVVSDTASMQMAISGIDYSDEPNFPKVVQLESGKLEDLNEPGTALIFAEQAKKLGVKVGDMLVLSVLTPRGINNTQDVRVVAIGSDMGILSGWTMFIPNSTLRELNQNNAESIGAVHLYVNNLKQIPQSIDLLKKALEAEGYGIVDREAKPFWMKMEQIKREDWTGQKLDITSWEDETSFFKWTTAAVDGLTYMLTTVLLIIIAVGIMNSMWIAIRERTREIGTLRAIGMQRRRVLAMFVIEAFTLGCIGTGIGATFGIIIAAATHFAKVPVPEAAQMFLMSNTLHFSLEMGSVFAAMGVITLCTTVVSIFPSTHAARMKPITAMSHIG